MFNPHSSCEYALNRIEHDLITSEDCGVGMILVTIV